MEYHVPALLKESIDGLNVREDGVYVDVTMGGGGHTREILRRLGPKGVVIAFDQDAEALKNAADDERLHVVHGNFRYLREFVRYEMYKMRGDADGQVDGLIADLGVSFHDFDTPERGFSFRYDTELDMRMNQQGSISAKNVVNEYDARRLGSVLYRYGELKNGNSLAMKIVTARAEGAIETTGQLMRALGVRSDSCGEAKSKENVSMRKEDKKMLTLVFQALRIEVNGEMDALKQMLTSTADVIKNGGRLSVITYHSLEDRMVKNWIKQGNVDGEEAERDDFGNVIAPFGEVGRKYIAPSEEEVERNPRSRSAKLRIGEKNDML